MAIPRGHFAEDQGELDFFVEALVMALGPRDELEDAQARRLARYYVRSLRLARIEAEALAVDTADSVRFSILDGSEEEKKGQAALSALRMSLDWITRVDGRTGRALERAVVLYAQLQHRNVGNPPA